MTIELTSITDLLRRANKTRSNALDLKELRDNLVEKEKAASAALEAAEKATLDAEEVRIKLAEAVAKDEECSEAETNEQKIARLEKEIEDLKRIQELEKQIADAKSATSSAEVTKKETKVTTTKVDAEKLNISSPPKAEATTEVYEPEAPTSGAKGSAARRK